MALPTLSAEVDFEGNPTATYHDTLFFDDSCQSYWRFSDDATLVDEKEASDGTFGGAPTLVSSLLPLDSDEALSFDGVDDYATVPTTSALQQSGSWTLEGLLKFDGATPGALKPLVTKGAFSVEVTAADKLQFSVQNHVSGTSTRTTVTSTTVLEADTAYHVECIHDASAQELRLVVNGRVEATASHTVGTELWGLPLIFSARHSGTAPSFGSMGAGYNAASVSSHVVGAPASIAVGNLLLAFTNLFGSSATITPPSGWLTLDVVFDAVNLITYGVYYKVAAAGDVGAASYTFTESAATGTFHAAIARFTGIDTAQPFANPPYTSQQTVSTTDYTIPAKHSQADDVLLVGLVDASRNLGFSSGTATERYDFSPAGGGGVGRGHAMFTLAASMAATSIPITATATTTAATRKTWIALKGPDAQDFCDVTLDEWSLSSRALDDDDALDHSKARESGAGAWTDITGAVKSFKFSRGRQYELDRFEAGVLNETLSDPARDYDASNTAGAYYPNVKTKRRHRLRATVGAETFPLYQGYVESWTPAWLTSEYQEAGITASDGMAALALAPVSGTLSAGLSGAQIHRLLDIARWPRELRNIDDGQFLMDTWTLSGFALSALQTLSDSELGQFFISADGFATFHDYAHRWTDARSLNVQALFSDVPADVDAGAIPYLIGGIKPSYDDSTTINQWSVLTAGGLVATVKDVVGDREAFPLAESRTTRLASVVDAETQALALLQRTARAKQRFDTIEVKPDSPRVADQDAAWQAVLGLEVSDRVRVVRTPAAGSQFAQDCFVEALAIEELPDRWQVSLSLSPVSPASFYETALRSDLVSYYRLNEAA